MGAKFIQQWTWNDFNIVGVIVKLVYFESRDDKYLVSVTNKCRFKILSTWTGGRTVVLKKWLVVSGLLVLK